MTSGYAKYAIHYTVPSQGQFSFQKHILLDGEQIFMYNIQLTNGIGVSKVEGKKEKVKIGYLPTVKDKGKAKIKMQKVKLQS